MAVKSSRGTERLSFPLAPLFLKQVAEHQRAGFADDDQLEPTLARLLCRGRACWPAIHLGEETFLGYLAERLDPQVTSHEGLAALNAEDLYLVCAFLQGEPQARAVCEQTLLPAVDAALLRLNVTRSLREDIRQTILLRLLVGDGSRGPRIQHFAGRGPLTRWVKVAAVRIGLNLIRDTSRERPTEQEALSAELAVEDNFEIQHLKRQYQQEFKQAFERAFQGLSSRDRNVLRYHFLDGLSIDEIGALYQVHRATAARWLVRIRQKLSDATLDGMVTELGLKEGEIHSIVALVQSRLVMSITRILRSD